MYESRLWGKIQILGLGASIKILLTSEEDIDMSTEGFLSRQEVVALINTLNQLSKSVEFASDVLSNNHMPEASKLLSSLLPTTIILSNSSSIIIIITFTVALLLLSLIIPYFRTYIFAKAKTN
jgi:hypothetical protein